MISGLGINGAIRPYSEQSAIVTWFYRGHYGSQGA